jgi:hypothetical protein
MTPILQKLGARVIPLGKPANLEAINAAVHREGVALFSVRWSHASQEVGHTIYAFRDVLGRLRYADRTGTIVGNTFNQCQCSPKVGSKNMMTISAQIGVWIPAANPKPPTTIRNVAMKPKNVAPLGKRMLAVFTGLGQRVTLLIPLINRRQPKITRSSASATRTNVECSKVTSLLRHRERNFTAL